MSNPRHTLGLAAEEAVAGWLAGAGWEILERRTRAGTGGEVDLLAIDPSRTLVAVEARARRSDRTGAAATTLDRRRIRRLEATLATYASTRAVRHRGLRVDLVTVEPSAVPEGGWRLRRIPGIGER
jgi:Holliday junction resolvase-like predicted endonuclease